MMLLTDGDPHSQTLVGLRESCGKWGGRIVRARGDKGTTRKYTESTNIDWLIGADID